MSFRRTIVRKWALTGLFRSGLLLTFKCATILGDLTVHIIPCIFVLVCGPEKLENSQKSIDVTLRY